VSGRAARRLFSSADALKDFAFTVNPWMLIGGALAVSGGAV
jgi:hypothetical protein